MNKDVTSAAVAVLVVQVIRVASKPSVLQSFVAVADQGSQLPRPQAAALEAAVEPPATFSQVSVNSLAPGLNYRST